jgi:quercetin dioxygenase-like cupin family protein
MAPLFRGLPDDRNQTSHWGVVLKGRLTFTYADGEDVIEAGEAYYAPPGHTPAADAGTETIEFSPTEELRKTMAVVMKNADAVGAQA